MDPREREIINIEKEIDAIQQTLRDNLAVKIEENRAEENFDHESETYECSICASTEIKKNEIGSGFPTLNPPSSTKQKEMKNHHKDTKKVHPKSVLQSFVSSGRISPAGSPVLRNPTSSPCRPWRLDEARTRPRRHGSGHGQGNQVASATRLDWGTLKQR